MLPYINSLLKKRIFEATQPTGHAGPRPCDCLARWLPGPCQGGVLADCLRLLGALGVTRPPWAMLGGRILETLCKSGPRRSAGAGILETLCRIGPGHSPAATVSRFWAPRGGPGRARFEGKVRGDARALRTKRNYIRSGVFQTTRAHSTGRVFSEANYIA